MGEIHKIKWLIDNSADQEVFIGEQTQKISLPYPPEIGFCFTEHIDLFDGTTIMQTTHNFTGEDRPTEIELGNFSVEFPYPMFIFHVIHSGIKVVKGDHPQENLPQINLVLNPGEVIFGRVNKYEVIETLKTEENVSTTVCLIPESRLAILMGVENTELLFENLGLSSEGTFCVTKVPESISKKLENASPENLEGSMRSLYAQSVLLQFLLELHLHTSTSEKFLKELEKNSLNIEELHMELIQIETKIPNLTEIAKKYGTTAEKLNYAFTKKFGQTIYAFLSNQRLEQAYQALEKTDISMKVLAHKIGYSHVNHFITAFKRKFGVTPGTIRKL